MKESLRLVTRSSEGGKMAEGGDPDDGKNPYSYGSSLIKSDKNNEMVNEDSTEDDVEPDLGIPRRRENGRLLNGEHDKTTNKREENPFSFRQFLKKDNTSNKSGISVHGPANHHFNGNGEAVAGPSRLFQNNSAPDFTSGLPDFVQGHFVLDGSHVEASVEAKVLPDFTLDNSSRGQHSIRDQKVNNRKRCHLTSNGESILEASFMMGSVRNSAQSDVPVTNSLPDFLSDGPMLSNVCDWQKGGELSSSKQQSKTRNSSDCRSKVNGEVADEAMCENEMLRRELAETRELLSKESQKLIELKDEIEKLKKKDSDEVIALEMMVQQVETNIQGTTERAAVAEATISKLKQEIKSLQEQVATVVKENETLKGRDIQRSTITLTAKHAAEQMRTAAETAQSHLMQLLTGVESLKQLAAFLADIDKTNDITTSKENT